MKEFLFIFRSDNINSRDQRSPEQMQKVMKQWQDWIGGLAAQNKLVNVGNRLSSEGRVVKPENIVTNGPYVELAEAIGGYTIINAASLDEAAELAKDCPILYVGGNVEVRTIVAMDDNS